MRLKRIPDTMLRGYLVWLLAVCAMVCRAEQSATREFAGIGFDGEVRVVNCFAQDSDGMIWIGTNSGLCSFDGYTTYSHSTGDAKERSQVNSMTIEGDTLYIGADCGLLLYDISRDAFCDAGAATPTDIRALAVNGDKLLIGSLNGFYEYDKRNHAVEECKNGLSNCTIYSILRIEGDGIYVGTYNGLNKYQPQSKSFRQIEMPTPNVKKNTFVNSMLYDERRGCVWVGTEGSL